MFPSVVRPCLWAVAVAVAVVAAGRGSDPAPPRAKGGPPALVFRGEWYWLGHFDADGNFIPDAQHPPYKQMPPTLVGGHLVTFGGNAPVYEHRSGRLVRGVRVDQPYGAFVPEVGSTVTDVKEFDLGKPDRLVWNLPETARAFWTEERKKQFPKGLPRGAAPPKGGVPAGWELVPFNKLYPDHPSRFARVIGDTVEFGRLSPEGEFIPAEDLPVVSRSGIKSPMSNHRSSSPRYYTLPFIDKGRGQTSEEVYEYRSGRLIKGVLQESGNFVPEVGSKVLDFRDYDPESGEGGVGRNAKGEEVRFGRRIYNLPGELRRTK